MPGSQSFQIVGKILTALVCGDGLQQAGDLGRVEFAAAGQLHFICEDGKALSLGIRLQHHVEGKGQNLLPAVRENILERLQHGIARRQILQQIGGADAAHPYDRIRRQHCFRVFRLDFKHELIFIRAAANHIEVF